MSGTHRNLLFWSISRCFGRKNHRWGLGPTETCNSSPKGAVLHAQNHRWGLQTILSFYSCANHAVICAQNDILCLVPIRLVSWSKWRCIAFKNRWWGLAPMETSFSVANHAVLNPQNDRGCLGPIETCYSGPKVAVLHPKTTQEGWNP